MYTGKERPFKISVPVYESDDDTPLAKRPLRVERKPRTIQKPIKQESSSDDDDDDIPLAKRKLSSPVQSLKEESDSEDDVPLVSVYLLQNPPFIFIVFN